MTDAEMKAWEKYRQTLPIDGPRSVHLEDVFLAGLKARDGEIKALRDLVERAYGSVRTHAMQTYSKVSAELADEIDEALKSPASCTPIVEQSPIGSSFDEHYKQEMIDVTVGWETDGRIPSGFKKVEAYRKGDKLIVLGEPKSNDESHNCDEMNCGRDHVLARIDLSNPPSGIVLSREEAEKIKIALGDASSHQEAYDALAIIQSKLSGGEG